MIDYELGNGLVQAGAPVEVGRNTGHFWFPSLHRLGEDTLICAVVLSADVAQGKWPADLFASTDAGVSWRLDRTIESYGHASVCRDRSTTLIMPYELWPAAPGDRVNGVADGTLLIRAANGSLSAAPQQVHFVDFPQPLAEYHEDELLLHHNGRILVLPDGSLLTTVYGKFDGAGSYCNFAVVSADGGATWSYRSTIAATDAAPEGPNEADAQWLDNGVLLCVYRVGGGQDFGKSYSRDQGLTWSAPQRMEGMGSVQPRLARLGNGVLVLTGGRPGLFLWLCTDGRGQTWTQVNLGVHHNQMLEGDEQRFSDAFCRAERGEDPAMSTSYTGLMSWGDDGVIVTYDRLANGWSGAPGPNGREDRVFSLGLKVSV